MFFTTPCIVKNVHKLFELKKKIFDQKLFKINAFKKLLNVNYDSNINTYIYIINKYNIISV